MSRRDWKATWWVMSDHPTWETPTRVRKCATEEECRQVAASLNRGALYENAPIYWAELFSSASVIDVERSEAVGEKS